MNRIYAARRRRNKKIDVLSDRKNRLLVPLSPKDRMSVENEVRKNGPRLIEECCTDDSSKFIVTKNDQKQMQVLTLLEYEIHLLEARNRNAKKAEISCDDFGEEVDATNPLPLLLMVVELCLSLEQRADNLRQQQTKIPACKSTEEAME